MEKILIKYRQFIVKIIFRNITIEWKKLSYNNYNDIYAALNISRTLPKNNGTVIVKHANPCGVSVIVKN